jgi:hypothetical protein
MPSLDDFLQVRNICWHSLILTFDRNMLRAIASGPSLLTSGLGSSETACDSGVLEIHLGYIKAVQQW